MHPGTEAILQHFDYSHLPDELAAVSASFHDLAWKMATDEKWNLDGPELTVGLRKLLEAKDCAVRAAR